MQIIFIVAVILLTSSTKLSVTAAATTSDQKDSEKDDETSRKIIGSSVVTSVSVILNGPDEIHHFSDAVGKPVPRPLVPPQVGSPINLLNPDRYEFYTFDDNGDLIKRLMTMKEIQSIVAGGAGEGTMLLHSSSHDQNMDNSVQDIVTNVQEVLNKEVLAKHNSSASLHHNQLDTPDVSSTWNLILPAIFGNTGGEIRPYKPQNHFVTPDSIILDTTTERRSTVVKQKPSNTNSYNQIADGGIKKPQTKPTTTTEEPIVHITKRKPILNSFDVSTPRSNDGIFAEKSVTGYRQKTTPVPTTHSSTTSRFVTRRRTPVPIEKQTESTSPAILADELSTVKETTTRLTTKLTKPTTQTTSTTQHSTTEQYVPSTTRQATQSSTTSTERITTRQSSTQTTTPKSTTTSEPISTERLTTVKATTESVINSATTQQPAEASITAKSTTTPQSLPVIIPVISKNEVEKLHSLPSTTQKTDELKNDNSNEQMVPVKLIESEKFVPITTTELYSDATTETTQVFETDTSYNQIIESLRDDPSTENIGMLYSAEDNMNLESTTFVNLLTTNYEDLTEASTVDQLTDKDSHMTTTVTEQLANLDHNLNANQSNVYKSSVMFVEEDEPIVYNIETTTELDYSSATNRQEDLSLTPLSEALTANKTPVKDIYYEKNSIVQQINNFIQESPAQEAVTDINVNNFEPIADLQDLPMSEFIGSVATIASILSNNKIGQDTKHDENRFKVEINGQSDPDDKFHKFEILSLMNNNTGLGDNNTISYETSIVKETSSVSVSGSNHTYPVNKTMPQKLNVTQHMDDSNDQSTKVSVESDVHEEVKMPEASSNVKLTKPTSTDHPNDMVNLASGILDTIGLIDEDFLSDKLRIKLNNDYDGNDDDDDDDEDVESFTVTGEKTTSNSLDFATTDESTENNSLEEQIIKHLQEKLEQHIINRKNTDENKIETTTSFGDDSTEFTENTMADSDSKESSDNLVVYELISTTDNADKLTTLYNKIVTDNLQVTDMTVTDNIKAVTDKSTDINIKTDNSMVTDNFLVTDNSMVTDMKTDNLMVTDSAMVTDMKTDNLMVTDSSTVTDMKTDNLMVTDSAMVTDKLDNSMITDDTTTDNLMVTDMKSDNLMVTDNAMVTDNLMFTDNMKTDNSMVTMNTNNLLVTDNAKVTENIKMDNSMVTDDSLMKTDGMNTDKPALYDTNKILMTTDSMAMVTDATTDNNMLKVTTDYDKFVKLDHITTDTEKFVTDQSIVTNSATTYGENDQTTTDNLSIVKSDEANLIKILRVPEYRTNESTTTTDNLAFLKDQSTKKVEQSTETDKTIMTDTSLPTTDPLLIVTDKIENPTTFDNVQDQTTTYSQMTDDRTTDQLTITNRPNEMLTESSTPDLSYLEEITKFFGAENTKVDRESLKDAITTEMTDIKTTSQALLEQTYIPLSTLLDSSTDLDAATTEVIAASPTAKYEDQFIKLGEAIKEIKTENKSPETHSEIKLKYPSLKIDDSMKMTEEEMVPVGQLKGSHMSPSKLGLKMPPSVSSLKIKVTNTIRKPIPLVKLEPAPKQALGLEESTVNTDADILDFARLCNELAFTFWRSLTSEGISSARSLVISPFALTSMLAMVFLGARGGTSGEMNEMLRLDDMVTFNPHLIFRNITDSVENQKDAGLASTAFVRELFSDRGKGKILSFFKDKAQQFYSAHVEEVSFNIINDIIRRRTNLLVKRHTFGKISEYLKTNNVWLNSPLAGLTANIFQTDCTKATTNERDGEMFFQVLPAIRQRRLVPIPAVVWKSGFTAGYDPEIDATAVAFGASDNVVSTIFILPGQQGHSAPGDNLERLESMFMTSAITKNTWRRLLTTLMPRPGLEVQIPRFSHRSFINATYGLQKMGLKHMFDFDRADLRGLTGSTTRDMFISDMVQINTFSTCGEDKITDKHHVEMYPAPPIQQRNINYDELDLDYPADATNLEGQLPLQSIFEDEERSFYDPLLDDQAYLELPLPLRPRQARVPEAPRLRFDKPFLYFVRHNPTGMILYMGRFNPRLLP